MLVWKPLQPRLLNRHTVNGLNAIEDILLWSRTISRIYLVTIQPDNPAEYWVSTLVTSSLRLARFIRWSVEKLFLEWRLS